MANTLMNNAIWQYVQVTSAPVAGPQPRLSVGTGNTGGVNNSSGASSLTGGYAEEPDYEPSMFAYSPRAENAFKRFDIPRTINVGDDGLHALNPTYRAHDFAPATRFFHQARQPANWQLPTFPPTFRQLLAYQQVRKYIVLSNTLQARVLPRDDYFYGYQTSTQVASNIGGMNALGSMGSA